MNKNEQNELTLYLKSLPRLADKHKPVRTKQSKKDFFYFMKTYFSHHIEHTKTDSSTFRRWTHKQLFKLSKKHQHLLITAYRGAAKTTIISQLFVLWLMLAKQESRFAVIISSTDTLAGLIFEVFKTELENNQNLIYDFNISMPNIWREKELVINTNGRLCKLAGFGAGKKLRGLKFLSYRPDLLILDDIENDEQVQSKQQRDKLESWFTKAVMKLPSRKNAYLLIIVGTVLHHDSLLSRLSKRQDFNTFNFPLVRRFPTNVDDRKSIKGIVLDDTEINADEVMREFYQDKAAFMAEFQNTPLLEEGRAFSNYQNYDVMPICEIYYIGLDPALGKKTGDYFGVAVLGKNDKVFYADVKGYKMSPVRLIGKIINLYVHYSKKAPTIIACETVQFQEFFKEVLKKEAANIGIALSVKEFRNTAPKQLRIDSIAPLINDGTILILNNNHLLIDELETYPKAAHDDLLDALEMAFRLYRKGANIDYKDIRKKLKESNLSQIKYKYA